MGIKVSSFTRAAAPSRAANSRPCLDASSDTWPERSFDRNNVPPPSTCFWLAPTADFRCGLLHRELCLDKKHAKRPPQPCRTSPPTSSGKLPVSYAGWGSGFKALVADGENRRTQLYARQAKFGSRSVLAGQAEPEEQVWSQGNYPSPCNIPFKS
jgi:hypothetical protein